MDLKIVKSKEARTFLEGNEICREYITTDKLVFGTSTLLPGQTGDIDAGHPNAHEVFYIVKGSLLLNTPDDKKVYQLDEGDTVVIPEGIPHQLKNAGETTGIACWALAPRIS